MTLTMAYTLGYGDGCRCLPPMHTMNPPAYWAGFMMGYTKPGMSLIELADSCAKYLHSHV